MEEFEEYGEDFYIRHETGPCEFVMKPPRYNSKIVYAINYSNKNKKDIIAIEPFSNKLLQEHTELGFEIDGIPHILFFRKLLDEAELHEMEINDYIKQVHEMTYQKIREYDKLIDILDELDYKYKCSQNKDDINESEGDDGKYNSSVLYGSSDEQITQYNYIFNFFQFFECAVYDIIALLYKKISKLKKIYHANRRKFYLMEQWKLDEEEMRKHTPFKHWRDWYDFLRKKWYEVNYKQVEDEANE